jgi:phosphopantothenoylcysteine decarboxylase/phosphopantothenate--cysteine ligase
MIDKEKRQKKVLLAMTGGIAAYKVAELTRLLKKQGYGVQVVMSASATQFITPLTFEALSGLPVYTQNSTELSSMTHIELTRQADVLLIAPATANCLAKITHGIADDFISTLASARRCPLIVAPAMNVEMWQNPANQRNVAQLSADGVIFFGPASGEQACGEVGEGRLLEPEAIVEALGAFFTPKILANQRILMTVGATYEAIDSVRGITNRSSGAMGHALARACRAAGATVTLISGITRLPAPSGLAVISATSAQTMLEAVLNQVGACDVFISVAAVSDYSVVNASEHKLKKEKGLPTLVFSETQDILATVASLPAAPFCVGFSAESDNLVEFAEAKRVRKKLPLMVANLAQVAMDTEVNQVTLLSDKGAQALPLMSKADTALAIVAAMASLLHEGKKLD